MSGIVKLPRNEGASWGLEFKFQGLSTEVYGNDDFMSARLAASKRGEKAQKDIDFQDSDEEYGMLRLTDDQFETYKAGDAAARRAMRLEVGF